MMSAFNPNDFLDNYLLYCQGNEVPWSFHRWSAISAMSCLVSRRVWVDSAIYQDYCNMYITLVGPPASRKSTAMSIARKLVQTCGVKIAPASVTKQRIWELMDSKNKKSGCNTEFEFDDIVYKVSNFHMFCNELVTMIAAGGDSLGMIEFLTDVWDRPFFDTDTKNAGSNIIDGPYITILACMTSDQTSALLKQDIITGGFSRRCIFVVPDGVREAVPRPRLTPEQAEAWKQLVRIGKELREVKGQFFFTDEAEIVWERWYNKLYDRTQSGGLAPVIANYLGSAPRFATQLSILMELSANRSTRTIQARTLERAIAWLEPLEQGILDTFTGAGRNPLSQVSAKILSTLRNAKHPMPFKALRTAVWDHATPVEFKDTLQFLKDTHQIIESSKCENKVLTIYFRLPEDSNKPQPFVDVQMSQPAPEIDLGPLSAIDLSD